MKKLSNVRICIAKKDVKVLKETINITSSNLFEICDIKEEFIGKDGLKYVFFGWNNIEWYKGYIDIWLLESRFIEFKQHKIPFYFIRVGRYYDVEEKFYYDNSFILNKSILVKKLLEFGGMKNDNKEFNNERFQRISRRIYC